MPELTPFEGRDVLRTSIAITRAGVGLSEAMKVEPREFHHGDRVYVVLETTVAKVQHVPYDKDDEFGPLVRVHSLTAGTATIVDEELVAAHIAAQAERNLKAREEAAGITRLPIGDADDAELAELEADLEASENAPGVEGEPAPDDAWEDTPPTTTPAKARGRTRKTAK